MILRVVDRYSSQESSISESEGVREDAYPCKGELLMIRLLNNQPSVDHVHQEDNIFYTR